MKRIFDQLSDHRSTPPPWNDMAPVREELFGVERLEQHAESLATAQRVTATPRRVLSLRKRLNGNAGFLLSAYRSTAREAESGRRVVHAAEWLLDNYHLVDEQIREIRDDLPPGYYRQLPKLAEGPFVGYPRVFGLAWAYVAHTDSHLDPEILRRYLVAYQRVQPLTIGELWAVAITLRIVLIENMRRLADRIIVGQRARADADALAHRLLLPGQAHSALEGDIATRPPGPLSELFAAQLAKQLRDQDPKTTPALGWLEERLALQGVSIDEVVAHAQQRQVASNVTVRNVITSMRLISDIDWAALFESVSLVDERLRSGSNFAEMDFPTRNLYRSAVEQLARGSQIAELEIAGKAVEAAQLAATSRADTAVRERASDPGYHLIAEGRPQLEQSIGFRAPPRLMVSRLSVRLGIGGYVGATLMLAAGLIGLSLYALWRPEVPTGLLILLAFSGFLPATEFATALVNRAITWSFGPVTLPGLALREGIPQTLRTLVAVPTLLTSEADLREQIERLEIHFLSGPGGDITFALLVDGRDENQAEIESDNALLTIAAEAVSRLNDRHGAAPTGDRFLLLYRRRAFNPPEGCWMGWERKRGKLHELNRLLRGSADTTFVPIDGRPVQVPPDVRYVITLDADTRLARDTSLRLIGKMAHPLNRPQFDPACGRVVRGYGILQPRVTPALPLGREDSLFRRVNSGPAGMDPYAAAVSDIYQDLFGEGSFTGKGIYDVDAFEAALAGRVPENAMLSHDLFEGIFARSGLASDVEVVEDFPSRYDVAAKRQHRWMRGDWQLLPWILGDLAGRDAVPAVGKGKMLDNLRRSLVAPAMFASIGLSWLLPMPVALAGLMLVLGAVAIPALLPIVLAVLPQRAGVQLRSHLISLAEDVRMATLHVGLSIAFLPDQAWRSVDAIVRTLVRVYVTRQHLLEWTTAAQTAGRPQPGVLGFYQQMAAGTLAGLAFSATAYALAPPSWPVILPIAILWLSAPALANAISGSRDASTYHGVTEADADELRLIARRTWRFFETFVTPTENMLPPDNFQEDPKPVVAHRTSPTNIGLYLLSAIAARDFGWAGTTETLDRLEATFATLAKMQRHRGHFYNWYDTLDLRVLEPPYVSSVDSGNLAGHLIAVANACEEWRDGSPSPHVRRGLLDTLHLARGAVLLEPEPGLISTLDEIEGLLTEAPGLETQIKALRRLADKAAKLAKTSGSNDIEFWIGALKRALAGLDLDRLSTLGGHADLGARLQALADKARAMALAMDFVFLLDPERKLLSIGFSQTDNSLDQNCYDLLASEARLASMFAIAKGDVATRHWFRLGRTATPLGSGSALISWSGSMFEYLMPSLVMRAPQGSLLEQTSRLVVQRQQAYGRSLGMPWGISESAYNARDIELTYQYSNFGVPGLGLKRGLSENLVVAPYATGLATMVDPRAATENFARLAGIGAKGRFGFYEALDFTRSRLPDNLEVAIVRCVMAHHQGMTIVAIANTLHDGSMRARFHREPMIKACELLLQERMPRDVAVAHPRAEEVNVASADTQSDTSSVRRLTGPLAGSPVTHLLSNGRYAVMLTASGAGFSRWRELAVSRWREDTTRDDWGSFIFLRDAQSGAIWPAGTHPAGIAPDTSEVIFCEDHAEFARRDGTLATAMDVFISSEDDGEVRRVSVTNSGRRPRQVDMTSYTELVLTSPAADAAHPAFAKMFVQTEFLPEFGALVATRRPRSPGEPRVWAAHFVVVEAVAGADLQYETDRARFIGRGRTIETAAAVADGKPLSNTVGTVLDPIFSLRQRVTIAPGKVARVAFWTLVASSRTELLDLIDKHHDRSAFDRAKTIAWTQAQVQLRHLDVTADEAADFQRLAAPIIYADRRFRASSETLARGAGSQSGLWPQAISGDFPIVLLRIDDIEDIAQLRQLLRAHEYWRLKRLSVDLVIVNERASSYVQDLQIAIETAIRTSQSRPRYGIEPTHGAIFALRADLITAEMRALLLSVARVSLLARRGSIADQLARIPSKYASPALPRPLGAPIPATRLTRTPPQTSPDGASGLEFFNGLGGFDKDGREYVTILNAGVATPAPWINVVANRAFGFQVSATGGGFTWAENSRENQLTAWSNDPVIDPVSEAVYIRDETTGDVWTPTAQPIRKGGTYIARHGFGYSRFEHTESGIEAVLVQFVPVADPVKISRLTLRNLSPSPRRLSVTAYTEWVLGTARGASGPFITTTVDTTTGAMFARNPWSLAFSGRIAFAYLGGQQTSWTADRTEFLGRAGNPSAPLALLANGPLSGISGAGIDPCTALQAKVTIAPGETVEVVTLLGQCSSAEEARELIERYRKADLNAVMTEVTDQWADLLGGIQVRTPDRAMDIMLNGWLLYQTIACRIWARSGFYQASGAYGFRDQLQDGMALSLAKPGETRAHILRAAGRQFVEGDVQHWWLPHSGQGVRTRISDDRVWLAFATATYIKASGDDAILDEIVPFLEGPALQAGEHDAFFQPMPSEMSGSLFEHCARGLDQAIDLTGPHGLPLMGTGDWNDGMNRVGEGGAGESVWLGWLLIRTIALFAPHAAGRDASRATRWSTHASLVQAAIERDGWDGDWYRRATFDDGSWLGSKDSQECQIDAIAQSWAVLSGAADPARAATAMASLDQHLIRPEDWVARLFWPPFDATPQDPGYIKGYPPGLRENGGQYSHAAMWAIHAFAKQGDGDKAASLFSLLNPINHARTPNEVDRYKVEPYVIAADVYSVAPHTGRGGWTWYTGAAGWMYRAGIEAILGITREGEFLVVAPSLPRAWPGFEATVTVGETQYAIHVDNRHKSSGSVGCMLDGAPVPNCGQIVRVPLDGLHHQLRITI